MEMTGLSQKLTIKNLKKITIYLKHYGFSGTFLHFMKQYQNNDEEYEERFKSHRLKKNVIEMQKEHHFSYEPLISILVPVYNTPPMFLMEMIVSVCEQTYRNWELCIANASPDNSEILDVLKECAEKENKIRIINIPDNLGIAGNTNAVLHIANGEYIGLLDHDDVLSRDALYEVVKKINEADMPEVLYSDEDKINEDKSRHFQPYFKPDFNLDLLRSNNYICHFFVAKKSLLLEIGGFQEKYNGAQDYDLILRCVEKAEKISHIPKVLYHWRTHEASTADNPESKRYAYDAGKKAIQEHLVRCGENGRVGFTHDPGFYRVKYMVNGTPLISVIILCEDDTKDAGKCIQSICRSTYKSFEFFIVLYSTKSSRNAFRCRAGALHPIPSSKGEKKSLDHIKVFNLEENDNIFVHVNSVVRRAKGKYLFLISANVKLADKFCIVELLANCQRENVGVVGGKLYSKGGKVQNAGMIVRGDNFVENMFEGLSKYCVGYMHRDSLQQNLSAVSVDCMMIKREVFEIVGGFHKKAGNAFAAIDFCLRVGEKGFLTVFNPYAKFYYIRKDYYKNKYSCMELEYMKKLWKQFLEEGDPAYNPNLAERYLLK